MIADVSYNQLKKIGIAGGSYLAYDNPKVLEIYHINQGPVIFRAIIKKDENTNMLAIQMDLKDVVQIKEPLGDEKLKELKGLKEEFEKLSMYLRLKR